jgi:hypothetical protein
LQELHSITKVSVVALQGSLLDGFSVDERIPWAGQRKTKGEEDMAYSLLSMFDAHMSLIYGEGRKEAFAQLQKEIDASSCKEQNEAAQGQSQATHSYYGPVFHGPISGRYVVPGTHVTGGMVNFDFSE